MSVQLHHEEDSRDELLANLAPTSAEDSADVPAEDDALAARLVDLAVDLPAADRGRLITMVSHDSKGDELATLISDVSQLRDALAKPDDLPDEPTGGWDAFEERLLRKAVHRPARQLRPWYLMQVSGLAASVLVAVAGWAVVAYLMAVDPPHWRAVDGEASDVAWVVPPETMRHLEREGLLPGAVMEMHIGIPPFNPQTHRELFDKVAPTFGNRMAWVATAGDEPQLGLLDDNGSADESADAAAAPLMALRVMVVERGNVITVSDVAVLAGQEADYVHPLAGGDQLRVRLLAQARSGNDKPRVRVWAGRQAADGEAADAALATVMPLGDAPTPVGRMDVERPIAVFIHGVELEPTEGADVDAM